MTFEDDLLDLESRVLEGAGGDFFAAVAALRRMLAMDAPGIERAIINLVIPDLEAAAVAGMSAAWALGGARALDAAMLGGLDANAIGDASTLRITPGPPKHLSDPLTGLDALLSVAKARSVALVTSGAAADAAAAPLFHAATTARLRVVTQINAASNQAALEVGDATGSPMVWEAERDACFVSTTRVHAPTVLGDDAAPATSLMALDPFDRFAFDPAASAVGLRGDPRSATTTAVTRPVRDRFRQVEAVSSRVYEGEVVDLTTAGGKQLTGTPNHPILTSRGWVRLGELTQGDHLVTRRVGEGALLDPDDDERPATIEEVAESLPVVASVVPTSAEDFHGDGAGSHVHVVWSDRGLGTDICETCGGQRVGECDFDGAAAKAAVLDCLRGLDLGFEGSGASAVRAGEGGDDFCSLRGSELVGAAEVASGSQAEAREPSPHGLHVDVVGVSYFLERLAPFVEADEVVSVRHRQFSGHVYNLETREGWYLAEDIVVHNCVYCLALAGEVVEPGQTFPPADLYADPPPSLWTVERPPQHGHCRCVLAVLTDPSYADTLKREAQRSILRGTSLASESNAVRIKAAARLLDRDPIAPKSVKDYARRAVKAGVFPKGRDAPTGAPRLRIN